MTTAYRRQFDIASFTTPGKKPTPASPVQRETQTVPDVVFEGYTIRQRRTLDSDVEAMQAVEGRRKPRTL